MTDYLIAHSRDNQPIHLHSQLANRHGLIAGATGTGKTVTLRKLAEAFSQDGVPVFMADVKGDLSGICRAGKNEGKVAERMTQYDLPDDYLQAFPVRFWDVYGEIGIPVRVSISAMGAMLLARLMNLNDTQEGVLNLVFKVADDKGWHLIDLKDLRGVLQYVSEHAADRFFGEPELNLQDWLQTDNGQGIINILNAEKLMRSPRLYSAFMLWFLAELFETLPEVGDPEKPKFVLFFDEAHLIFDNASKVLIEQVEQCVRLIRSKGVGVYFVTQNPLDLPDTVLGQLGNRVQHALRAFTPRDQKAVKSAADTFRSNPQLNVATAITELAVGEALVSCLDDKGQPEIVQRAFIMPPQSQLAPLPEAERNAAFQADSLYPVYKDLVDNFSAYEALQQLAGEQAQAAESAKKSEDGLLGGFLGGLFGSRKKAGKGLGYDLADSVGSQINKQVTKAISRSIMGVIKNMLK